MFPKEEIKMQIDTNTTGVTDATQPLDNPGFDQMAQGLKDAIQDFSTEQSPASFEMIVSALRPIGDLGLRVWNFTSSFVRRHPVETAVGVAAIGFAVALMLRPRPAIRSSDGRQY